jgi:hypothetical protein
VSASTLRARFPPTLPLPLPWALAIKQLVVPPRPSAPATAVRHWKPLAELRHTRHPTIFRARHPLSTTTRETLSLPAHHRRRFPRRSQAPRGRLPNCAAEPPHQWQLCPNQAWKSSICDPYAALCLSPAGHGHRTRRIPASRTGEPPNDHIARSCYFQGRLCKVRAYLQ